MDSTYKVPNSESAPPSADPMSPFWMDGESGKSKKKSKKGKKKIKKLEKALAKLEGKDGKSGKKSKKLKKSKNQARWEMEFRLTENAGNAVISTVEYAAKRYVDSKLFPTEQNSKDG